MTEFFVKVSDPDFQLPQVVLDNLPYPVIDPDAIKDAVNEYLDGADLATPQYVNDAVEAHRVDPLPHPAYDVDIPDLSLIFENHLV